MLAGFYTTQGRKYVAALLHTSAPTELLVCKMNSKIMAQDTSKKMNAWGWKLHKRENCSHLTLHQFIHSSVLQIQDLGQPIAPLQIYYQLLFTEFECSTYIQLHIPNYSSCAPKCFPS